MERLDRVLGNLGYCSRKQSARFLRDFEVTVDTERLSDPSVKVDSNKVRINNEPLDRPDGIFIMLNKPAGYICSHDGGEGVLVYELLPHQWLSRNPVPSTIGRLDKDTTGVILITDNTQLIHTLTSPKRTIDKEYEVTVHKALTADLADAFMSGTLFLKGEEKPCLPAGLNIVDETHAKVILHEGRYHQVKRMFGYFGYIVTSLHRSRFGPYTLNGLESGGWMDLEMPNAYSSPPQ